MTVGGCVDLQHEGGEVHVEPPKAGVPDKPTSTLVMVSSKTVQWIAKGRNMEDVPNKEFLAVEGDNRRTTPQHWSKSFVSHANADIGNSLVRDEGRVV